MIDWLLRHPVLIFLIVAGASSLIKKLKSSADESSAPQSRPQPYDDTEDAERTRRLQEEIRRKIAERRGQIPAPPPLPSKVPPPLFPVPSWAEPKEERSPYKVEEPVARVETVPVADPILAQQRELAEQLAAIKTAQHVEVNRASWQISKPAETEAEAVIARADDVYGLRELRNARSLRKAIILREVLGPPVALR